MDDPLLTAILGIITGIMVTIFVVGLAAWCRERHFRNVLDHAEPDLTWKVTLEDGKVNVTGFGVMSTQCAEAIAQWVADAPQHGTPFAIAVFGRNDISSSE